MVHAMGTNGTQRNFGKNSTQGRYCISGAARSGGQAGSISGDVSPILPRSHAATQPHNHAATLQDLAICTSYASAATKPHRECDRWRRPALPDAIVSAFVTLSASLSQFAHVHRSIPYPDDPPEAPQAELWGSLMIRIDGLPIPTSPTHTPCHTTPHTFRPHAMPHRARTHRAPNPCHAIEP